MGQSLLPYSRLNMFIQIVKDLFMIFFVSTLYISRSITITKGTEQMQGIHPKYIDLNPLKTLTKKIQRLKENSMTYAK